MFVIFALTVCLARAPFAGASGRPLVRNVYAGTAFEAIDCRGFLEVTCSREFGHVALTGDEDVLPLIEGFVRDGGLVLDATDVSPSGPSSGMASGPSGQSSGSSDILVHPIRVVLPVSYSLRSVSVSGAVNFRLADPFNVHRFSLTASGSSRICADLIVGTLSLTGSDDSLFALTGSAHDLHATLSGNSRLDTLAGRPPFRVHRDN